jgi:heme O synthase-like polyprenyltransferase
MPVAMRMAGPVYLVSAFVMGLAFLGFAVNCAARKRRGDARWLFLVSIMYLPALLGVMMVDKAGRGW